MDPFVHVALSGACRNCRIDHSRCDKLSGAHGIAFELDLDRPQHRAILRRYQEVVKPGIPIRVLVRPEHADRYRELLSGVEVWTHEPSAADLDAFSARVEGYRRVSED